MKKTTESIIHNLMFVIVFLVLVMPAISHAALVPCGTTDPATPLTNHTCTFTDFMTLINNVIKFILFELAVPIAAIMFAYAGFKLVTSGGSTEARGQAKNIATNALIGLVLAAGAWLIVRTILSILGYHGDWIGFPFVV